MPNAWDIGSAVLLASLGFEALATTSGGFATSKGRLDGAMTRGEVLAHVAELAGATALPLSADLENCFADDPEGVARTIAEAIEGGVAGASVEDFTGDAEDPIYDVGLAAARVEAAAEAAHNGAARIVLTARAENYIHGRPDLADTIARLQAYQEAGADVLFAPRLDDPDELRQLMAAVDLPGQRAGGAGGTEHRRVGRPRREPGFGGRRLRRGRLRRPGQRGHRAARAGHLRLLGAHQDRRPGRPDGVSLLRLQLLRFNS